LRVNEDYFPVRSTVIFNQLISNDPLQVMFAGETVRRGMFSAFLAKNYRNCGWNWCTV